MASNARRLNNNKLRALSLGREVQTRDKPVRLTLIDLCARADPFDGLFACEPFCSFRARKQAHNYCDANFTASAGVEYKLAVEIGALVGGRQAGQSNELAHFAYNCAMSLERAQKRQTKLSANWKANENESGSLI